MSQEFLMDKHDIEQVYIRYCEIVDAKSFDDMHEVFTADTFGDYTHSLPGVTTTSRAELVAAMHANLGPDSNCGATHHNVGNFRVAVDGDNATAKVHYYAVHRGIGEHEGALYTMWGQYEDRLVRTANGWRVAHRVYKSFLTDGPVVTSGRSTD